MHIMKMNGYSIDGLYCKSLKCGNVLSKKIIDAPINRYLVTNDGIVYSIHEQQKDGRPAGIYFYRFFDERIVPLVQGEDDTFGNFAVCGNMLVYFDKNEGQMRQIDRINGGTPLTLFDISTGRIIEINVLENCVILNYSIEQETPTYWKASQHRIYVFDYEGNALHVFDG